MIIFVQFWGVYYLKPLFVTILLALLVQKGFSENAFSLKFQDWKEDNDRIHVRSWYAGSKTPLSTNWELGVVGMVRHNFRVYTLGQTTLGSRKLALSPRGGKTSRYN